MTGHGVSYELCLAAPVSVQFVPAEFVGHENPKQAACLEKIHDSLIGIGQLFLWRGEVRD